MNFDEVSTYSWDRELFRELGLKPFSFSTKGIGQGEYYVGKVKTEEGYVKVYVTGVPAQFWRFVIHCNETKRNTTFSTGSGSFKNYWPFAKAIMEGMVVIK